ncbi:MAG TPA: aminotransferase DegT, partial [Flavobacterium sp.]|nr:aminotransferase DegT [Flavobacterium sp.]
PRRYFYPSLNTIHYVSGSKMPISESVASRVLCLPLYAGLEVQDVKKIINIITN